MVTPSAEGRMFVATVLPLLASVEMATMTLNGWESLETAAQDTLMLSVVRKTWPSVGEVTLRAETAATKAEAMARNLYMMK
jgi:hypothetical protein